MSYRIFIFCPMCARLITLEGNKVGDYMHHSEFGVVCGKECLDKAENKYATMILQKSEEQPG